MYQDSPMGKTRGKRPETLAKLLPATCFMLQW